MIGGRTASLIGGLLLAAVAVMGQTNSSPSTPEAALPLTTHSPKARRLVEQALRLNLDQVEQEKAAAILRKALKIDPGFAIAHEILAQISLDPAEQVSEQTEGLRQPKSCQPC